MQYLNPFDLLDVQINSLSELQTSTIKKSKKKILAEIELSDNESITINKIEYSKSDVLSSFDNLDNKDKVEFFFFLFNYKELNNFLYFGETKFFMHFRQEYIFKSSQFLKLLSPYYAPKFNILLSKALEKKSIKALNILKSIPLLVDDQFKDKAYKGAYSDLQGKIDWLDNRAKEIKTNSSIFNEENITNLPGVIKNEIAIDMYNLLPSYFQEIRNNLSFAIRNISIITFNNIGDSDIALTILRLALLVETDGITRDNIEKDFKQIEDINNERKETEKYEPILKKYASAFIKLKTFQKELDEKTRIPTAILIDINNIINPDELNSLPILFDEVRNQIIFSLRNLAITSWNNFSDVERASSLLNIARLLNTNVEMRSALEEDMDKVNTFRKEMGYTNTQQLKQNGSKATSYTGIIWTVSIIILIVVLNLTNNKSSTINKNNKPKEDYYTTPTNNKSEYEGNQLKNGASPYNKFFGKGIYNKNTENWIEIKTDQYDVVVCLVDYYSERTIRNEYIRAKSTFQMTNVPNGTYYIKGFFGKDWNPTKNINSGKIKGGFDTNFHFSKTSGSNGTFTLHDDGYQYSTMKIILYSVIDGNTNQININENQFFN